MKLKNSYLNSMTVKSIEFMFVAVLLIMIAVFCLMPKKVLCSPQTFSEIQLVINDSTYTVDKAESNCQLQQGLMNVESLRNDGMLFVFKVESVKTFWMKDTLLPLSIAFINQEGIIVDIQEMKVEDKQTKEKDMPSYKSKFVAKYALEANKDFFKQNNIKVGDKVLIP